MDGNDKAKAAILWFMVVVIIIFLIYVWKSDDAFASAIRDFINIKKHIKIKSTGY